VFEPLVIWDLPDDPDGNVAHIAEHGITQDEVESVVGNPANPTVASKASGYPITFGETDQGKYIAVVWESVLDDPRTIKPITAYETPRPKAKHKGRKHR
jgi:hypothetical protein